jgi:hypothetical protein
MDKRTLVNIIRFVALPAIQILLLNNIVLFGYYQPYLYVLAILLLPEEMSKAMVMMIAFLTGFFVDIFSGTYGIHAFASVLMAFVRPIVLGELVPFDGYDKYKDFLPGHYGMKWFLKYSLWTVAIHHLALIVLEAFSFANLGLLFSQWFVDVLLTESLLLLTIFATSRNQ